MRPAALQFTQVIVFLPEVKITVQPPCRFSPSQLSCRSRIHLSKHSTNQDAEAQPGPRARLFYTGLLSVFDSVLIGCKLFLSHVFLLTSK